MEDKSTEKLDSLTNFEEKFKIRFWLKNKTKTIQGHQDALQTITAHMDGNTVEQCCKNF